MNEESEFVNNGDNKETSQKEEGTEMSSQDENLYEIIIDFSPYWVKFVPTILEIQLYHILQPPFSFCWLEISSA